MPSALETLVKVLKLEQNTGYQDKAVIGGLESFASEWASSAHAQARKPEHHALVDELVTRLADYRMTSPAERSEAIRYMLGRITGRIPPAASSAAPDATQPLLPVEPPKPAPESPHAPQPPQSPSQSPAQPQQRSPRPPPSDPRRERPRPPAEQQQQAQQQRRDPRKPEPQKSRPAAQQNHPPRRNDSHSLFGERNVELPIIQEDDGTITSYEEKYSDPVLTPPSLDDVILEPIQVEPELPEVRPPRAKLPPPRRRRDNRTPEQKTEALAAIKKSVSMLPGIGPKMAEKLESLEVRTIEQLLFTFPRRYDDYTTMKPLNRIRPGEMVSVAGTVRSTAVIKGRRNIDVFNVTLDDGTATMSASFFNQPYLKTRITRGSQIVFSGKTELYLGRITMTNPHWEFVDQDALTTRSIVPVYPLTSSLSPANMRKSTEIALDLWGDALPDIMPDSVLDRTGLAEYSWSIRQMHRPESMDMLEHARERLMFDDLILLQMGVLRNRRAWQAVPADPLPVSDEWLNRFFAVLPFPLTGAQQRAIAAIRGDIARPVPMNRLLQGDVGAGKTVVAAAALAMAVSQGYQGALMAPTGILAEQHYRGLSRLFSRLPNGDQINIRLLTSATPTQERNDILWGLGEGTVHIVIGTHALIQEDVNFWKLGVAVVDEQHRFGVEQRGRLRGKGKNPHVLVMTATPIPRTLALTMYADLDLTILDEMPPGRTPIRTQIVTGREREYAYSFMRAQVREGRQAFIVYPLVEASESESMTEVRSAVEEYKRLSEEVFPEYRIGLLHGRMSAAEKDAVMAEFSANRTQILVSTAVVEVGIDVPNASVMMIEGANRFGLAQLHQFRGRVGRGQHASYCFLIADSGNEPDNPRLKALEETSDGFKLAEIDWQLRGAGELLGTRQSGGGAGRLADFMTPHIVELAQQEARALYAEDPLLNLPEHTLLRQRLLMVYGEQNTSEVS